MEQSTDKYTTKWPQSSRWEKIIDIEDQILMQAKKFRRNRVSIYVLQRSAL